jgi:hypothetical protein
MSAPASLNVVVRAVDENNVHWLLTFLIFEKIFVLNLVEGSG